MDRDLFLHRHVSLLRHDCTCTLELPSPYSCLTRLTGLRNLPPQNPLRKQKTSEKGKASSLRWRAISPTNMAKSSVTALLWDLWNYPLRQINIQKWFSCQTPTACQFSPCKVASQQEFPSLSGGLVHIPEKHWPFLTPTWEGVTGVESLIYREPQIDNRAPRSSRNKPLFFFPNLFTQLFFNFKVSIWLISMKGLLWE